MPLAKISDEDRAALDAAAAAEARLDFLLKQSDVFAHFVKNKSTLAYV
jgi:hypothetical protein